MTDYEKDCVNISRDALCAPALTAYLLINDYIEKKNGYYTLTERGEEYTHYTRSKYELPI